LQNSISTTDREVLEKERARENNISEARGYRGLILATTPQGHREWYSAYEKQVGIIRRRYHQPVDKLVYERPSLYTRCIRVLIPRTQTVNVTRARKEDERGAA